MSGRHGFSIVPSAAADGEIAQALLKAASGSTDPVVLQAATGIAHLKAGRYTEAVASLSAAFDASQQRSAPIAFPSCVFSIGLGSNVST